MACSMHEVRQTRVANIGFSRATAGTSAAHNIKTYQE